MNIQSRLGNIDANKLLAHSAHVQLFSLQMQDYRSWVTVRVRAEKPDGRSILSHGILFQGGNELSDQTNKTVEIYPLSSVRGNIQGWPEAPGEGVLPCGA
ncbi:MAG: hypothetical protein LBO00_08150, partial [Zoogloeaceae bacterium]|nr:hypothetical protein [Zoogloeaceae bacterium]